MYVIECANFITVLDHMSHCSGARLGILWEDSINVGKNLVKEIRETQCNF